MKFLLSPLFFLINFILNLLFIVFLSSFIIAWSFSELTEYNTLKPLITNIILQQIKPQMNQNDINQMKYFILEKCHSDIKNITNYFVGINYTIECGEVNETTDILSYISNKSFNSLYYKKYECDFITCFKSMNIANRFFLLISEKTHLFLKDLKIKLFVVTIICGIVLFIIKGGSLNSKVRSFGILFIITGLPGLFIYNIIEPLKYQTIPKESIDLASPLINEILAIIGEKLSLVAAVGICLVGISFIIWFIEKKK